MRFRAALESLYLLISLKNCKAISFSDLIWVVPGQSELQFCLKAPHDYRWPPKRTFTVTRAAQTVSDANMWMSSQGGQLRFFWLCCVFFFFFWRLLSAALLEWYLIHTCSWCWLHRVFICPNKKKKKALNSWHQSKKMLLTYASHIVCMFQIWKEIDHKAPVLHLRRHFCTVQHNVWSL